MVNARFSRQGPIHCWQRCCRLSLTLTLQLVGDRRQPPPSPNSGACIYVILPQLRHRTTRAPTSSQQREPRRTPLRRNWRDGPDPFAAAPHTRLGTNQRLQTGGWSLQRQPRPQPETRTSPKEAAPPRRGPPSRVRPWGGRRTAAPSAPRSSVRREAGGGPLGPLSPAPPRARGRGGEADPKPPPGPLIGCRPGGGSRGSRLAPLSGALAPAEGGGGRHGRERRSEPGRWETCRDGAGGGWARWEANGASPGWQPPSPRRRGGCHRSRV